MMQDDLYGRTQINPLHLPTKILLFSSSISIVFISLFLRRPNQLLWKNYNIITPIPSFYLISLLLILVFAGVIVSLKSLGTLPIFYLNTASDANQISYEDVFAGPVNFIGWGAGRFLSVWLTISMIYWHGSWANYLRKNWFLTLATTLALIFNTLDGLRNMLFLSMLTLVFALSMRGVIKIRHLLIAGVTAVLFFSLAGIFKQGEKSGQGMIYTTGNDFFDKSIYSFVSYAEPNLFNLDNLIMLSPQLKYGGVFFSHLFPGPIVRLFMDQPDTVAQIMSETGSYAQPGLTFRTIYADLFVDFGLLGTVFVATIIYGLGVLCFNRANISPYFLLGFIYLSPAICFFPFINTLSGIQTFISAFVFFTLKFSPVVRN